LFSFFSTLSLLLVPGARGTQGPGFVGFTTAITTDKAWFNSQTLNLIVTPGGFEFTDMVLVVFRITT